MRVFSYLFALSCVFPAYSSINVEEFSEKGTKRTVTNAQLEERSSQPKKMKISTEEDIKDLIKKAEKGDQVARQSIFNKFKGNNENILKIKSKEIDSVDAISLVTVLSGTNIHTLDLSNNKIGCKSISKQNHKDDIAEKFAEALKATNIHTIDLSYNKITSGWTKAFAKNLKNSNVRTINLVGHDINSSYAWDIAKNLYDARVETVHITQIGARARQKLPLEYPNMNWDFN